jgi:hypothetical protein
LRANSPKLASAALAAAMYVPASEAATSALRGTSAQRMSDSLSRAEGTGPFCDPTKFHDATTLS